MKDAPLVRLTRAQIHRAPGLDITMKSAGGEARQFAPTKNMVLGYKNWQELQAGRPPRYRGYPPVSTEEYTAQYTGILDQVPVHVWRWLWEAGLQENNEIILLCYCRDDWFCHTHLLIDYACAKWPKAFTDGRAPSAP